MLASTAFSRTAAGNLKTLHTGVTIPDESHVYQLHVDLPCAGKLAVVLVGLPVGTTHAEGFRGDAALLAGWVRFADALQERDYSHRSSKTLPT